MGLNLDKVYIVHGIKGYEERENILKKSLEDLNLTFEFVTESFDEEQNEKWIQEYFVEDIRNYLSKGALYCTLVHILCYRKFLESDNEFAIIFENDVCFLENFVDKAQKVIEEARGINPNGVIVSLENSTLKFPAIKEIKKEKLLYPEEKGRCAGAYLIDRKAAYNILESLKTEKCHTVIDWWHNALIEKRILNMYWAHPPLIEQGSFNGKFTSSISIRDNGTIRGLRWKAQKIYKMYIQRWIKHYIS